MDTARAKGASLLHPIAVLFLGALCGLLATCKDPELQPLRVRVSGCSLLWDRASHLVCANEPDDKLRLILSIEGPPLARLRFRIGNTADGYTTLSASGHAAISEPFPKTASRVTLRAESAEGEAEYILEVQPKMPFDRAYARHDALDCGQAARRCLGSAQKLLALFLAQFEAGTGRYLKLLLAVPGAQGKVLAVIRHARVRALRTYARAPGASGGQRRTDKLLARYSSLLGQREETKAELDAAPSAEQNKVRTGSRHLRAR